MLLAITLFGCGGGGVDSVGGDREPTGQLSIAITDAPVDYATEVVVTIDAVELKPTDGTSVLIEFDAQRIYLLFFKVVVITVIL